MAHHVARGLPASGGGILHGSGRSRARAYLRGGLRRMIVPPWNLSSAARDFKEADAYLVSIPKCGRTWLRVFLGAYLEKTGLKMGIKHTHDLWDHRTKSRWYEQIRGKRLIPMPERRTKPILLVVRDPRDLLV